ncbi:ASCH domain-containing protein [Marinomonas sp. A3A]|uniref:N(4)-acetylcytidine aminohydrolase n=1 Tax=Marinomonas sp. A3A TaxID=2065312 RepID=UPI001BB3010D|nr:N(4)-acetylcytidine aminohydrolase [Marinomonas sp. A3A]QUX89948.1 ASCH domain-containing protein [Marinomonas sp. A3A]
MTPNIMTFFERFEADILSGKKTITLRDEAEKHYVPGSVVTVSTFEDGREFCRLKILSVEPVLFDALTDYHAEQENMTLDELREVIQVIYPGIQHLYLISYQLVDA